MEAVIFEYETFFEMWVKAIQNVQCWESSRTGIEKP